MQSLHKLVAIIFEDIQEVVPGRLFVVGILQDQLRVELAKLYISRLQLDLQVETFWFKMLFD